MSDKTKINWCDATWNPVTGCTPVSAGCEHCYAKRLAGRFPQIHGFGIHGGSDLFCNVRFHPDRLDIPFHWRKPRKIFVCSMGDLFHEQVAYAYIGQVFSVIRDNPRHIFLILTKRPERIEDVFDYLDYGTPCGGILPNLWLGVTAENQEMADKRIPILLQIPAAKRFVSVEPILEAIRLEGNWNGYLTGWKTSPYMNQHGELEPVQEQTEKLDWIICGPETGPGKRPMNPAWADDLKQQCDTAGVPFFDKTGRLAEAVREGMK